MTVRAEYDRAYELECGNSYKEVDAFEAAAGFKIPLPQLQGAARVLACPVKANPPNWQHGRVVYALARSHLELVRSPVLCLDIGTAKGFSALCMQWAMQDAGVTGQVFSVDVIDPAARVVRNTVAEVDGLKTLAEILSPWPEARAISFEKSTGVEWLAKSSSRIHVAFVDGKHSFEAVSDESRRLKERQSQDDVVIFDDVQIPGVKRAIDQLEGYRKPLFINVTPLRGYAVLEKM